jgi:hypothetical protein
MKQYKNMLSYNNLSIIANNPPTPLCEIMNRHGSDKGNGHHNYTKLYHEMFKFQRNEPLNILEIGIGSINTSIPSNMRGGELGAYYQPGASIRAWREYFPFAQIFCCDIDNAIINIFDHDDKITSFHFDQYKHDDIHLLFSEGNVLHNVKFDLIIDDGLHFFPINCNVMKNFIPFMKESGTYIIEDIIHSEYNYRYIDVQILNQMNYQYVRLPNPNNTCDNNLFILKF